MSGFRKFILPVALVVLAISIEIVGIIFCGKMLPDYKNEVFAEEKKNITQLIFVNDEDNSRFYPWLSYHEDEFTPAQSYIENHLYDPNIEFMISSYDETYSFKEMDDRERKEVIIYNFNQMILYAIETFDAENYPEEEIDFLMYAKFDNNASILCIKDCEYKNRAGETKLLDLVMKVDTKDMQYFRIRDKSPAKPTSQQISQKSKELSENVDETLEYFAKWPEELIKEESEDYYTDNEIQQTFVETDNSQKYNNHNIINEYLISIPVSLGYWQDDNYHIIMNEGKLGFQISVVVPSVLLNSQYTVFSNGDELMVVFSGSDDASKYSDTILYYSISEDRIIGFSIGNTF